MTVAELTVDLRLVGWRHTHSIEAVHDALIELLGSLLEGIVDLSGSTDAPDPVPRVPKIAERYLAKVRIQLPGTVAGADGKLSGRVLVTLNTGDVVRVDAISSRGPRALLAVAEQPLAADGTGSRPESTAKHSVVATFRILERDFELLEASV